MISTSIQRHVKFFRLFILMPVGLVLFFSVATAQSENWPIGTREASMANAGVAESDLWSVHHNQAGLGFYPYFSIGFHHENKFIVDEYSLHALALSIPVHQGTLGLSYTYFGYQVYNESKFGLGYGKQFGNGFSTGIQMNYHYNYLEGEYGNRHALTAEAGIQYKPGENLVMGAHLSNPTRSKMAAYDQDTIPSYFNIGISYRPLENYRLNLQLNKRLDRSFRILAGMEYMLLTHVYLRGGIMTSPVQGTFGLGYHMGKIGADIGFTHHRILGFTPHFSFMARLSD